MSFNSVICCTLKSILRGQSKLCTQKFCLDQFQAISSVHMDMLVALFKATVSKGNIFVVGSEFHFVFFIEHAVFVLRVLQKYTRRV